jgi:microcystin-dependent protein
VAQPYVGEIRMFAGNFAPAGWQFCDGSLLPISENETLFQLIGTTYGGDGASTFGLPDLRGRIPIHQGNGFILAETGGDAPHNNLQPYPTFYFCIALQGVFPPRG